jgi:hypothetical protein
MTELRARGFTNIQRFLHVSVSAEKIKGATEPQVLKEEITPTSSQISSNNLVKSTTDSYKMSDSLGNLFLHTFR